jgi:hypothetical protein
MIDYMNSGSITDIVQSETIKKSDQTKEALLDEEID